MRLFAAILIGLVFQLVQLAPVIGADAACPSTVAKAGHCSCCEELDACPCVEQSEPDSVPQPLPPVSSELLKLPIPALSDAYVGIEVSGEALSIPTNPPTRAEAGAEFYRGVPLGTAFCTFVI